MPDDSDLYRVVDAAELRAALERLTVHYPTSLQTQNIFASYLSSRLAHKTRLSANEREDAVERITRAILAKEPWQDLTGQSFLDFIEGLIPRYVPLSARLPLPTTDRLPLPTIDASEQPPKMIIVWDPEVVSPEKYARLVKALGDVVRASGGVGIEFVKGTGLSVPAGDEVMA